MQQLVIAVDATKSGPTNGQILVEKKPRTIHGPVVVQLNRALKIFQGRLYRRARRSLKDLDGILHRFEERNRARRARLLRPCSLRKADKRQANDLRADSPASAHTLDRTELPKVELPYTYGSNVR